LEITALLKLKKERAGLIRIGWHNPAWTDNIKVSTLHTITLIDNNYRWNKQ